MNRLRKQLTVALFLALMACGTQSLAQAPPEKDKPSTDKPAEKWLFNRTLAFSAAPAPTPALKYRLYPSYMDRKPGNAVPIYMRFAHERSQARRDELREKPVAWNELPLEKLPLVEVKKYLGGYAYYFGQFDLGARRNTAEWNYTLEIENPIALLLPDMQEMRLHAPMLVLKARTEIAERRYADAVRTLETGFSFSQQINEGPFLVTSLVAIAVANQFTDCTLELIQCSNAPNLYWALSVLPRPMLDLRHDYEFELTLIERQFPILADLDRSRVPEQWDATLAQFRNQREAFIQGDGAGSSNYTALKPGTSSSDPASKSPDLPIAKKYLADVVGLSEAQIGAMPASQVLLLHIRNYYRELSDDAFKSTYLAGWQRQGLDGLDKTLKSLPDIEAAWLPRYLLPAIKRVNFRDVLLQRKLAALQVIEALRMHAAVQGRLPEKLDDVVIVPLPLDPGTGKSFEYKKEGESAVLTSQLPGESLDQTGLRYHLSIKN